MSSHKPVKTKINSSGQNLLSVDELAEIRMQAMDEFCRDFETWQTTRTLHRRITPVTYLSRTSHFDLVLSRASPLFLLSEQRPRVSSQCRPRTAPYRN